MRLIERESGLLVAEYGGNGRSGKGSIVGEEAKQEGVASDEAGADYRAVTRALITDGHIELDMSEKEIARRVAEFKLGELAALAAGKNQIIKAHGLEALYQQDVNTLVPYVGKMPLVREAVKAGFQQRVAAARDDPSVRLLLVDGRNLKPVVEKVEGAKVFLRTFVECTAEEAARRECLRDGIPLGSREATTVLEGIRARNKTDASRDLDPVRSDENALHYGEGAGKSPSAESHRIARRGLGRQAVREGRQIVLDTTNLSKKDMIAAAHQMLAEAYDTRISA